MLDELFIANGRYAETFSLGGLAPRAAKALAIVTCMDTRLEPLAMLGLVPGDAKILRNAGGRVTSDSIRSLIFASLFLEVTTVVVLQHEKCALMSLKENDVRERLASEGLLETSMEFMTMSDPDEALNFDVELIRDCQSLPNLTVEGWRYDVETGLVRRVVPT